MIYRLNKETILRARPKKFEGYLLTRLEKMVSIKGIATHFDPYIEFGTTWLDQTRTLSFCQINLYIYIYI